jgi:hypothetical protein
MRNLLGPISIALCLFRTATPAPIPRVQPGQRRYGFARVAVVAFVALVVGGDCGTAVGSSNNQSTASHASASPSAAADGKAPASTPTSSSRILASAYADVVLKNTQPSMDAYSKVGSECGSGVAARCRTAALTVRSTQQSFLRDLSQLTVPACLGSANLELGAAVEMGIDAATMAISGIDANNSSKISEAADILNLATDHLNKANAAVRAAKC